jgi:hypothetical protein
LQAEGQTFWAQKQVNRRIPGRDGLKINPWGLNNSPQSGCVVSSFFLKALYQGTTLVVPPNLAEG